MKHGYNILFIFPGHHFFMLPIFYYDFYVPTENNVFITMDNTQTNINPCSTTPNT